MRVSIGILTISDRASSGEYNDLSGAEIKTCLEDYLATPWTSECQVVPDEWGEIESALVTMVDDRNCCLVVTTGGTGPAVRDITPDVTEAVCDKMLPGFGEQMRSVSLQYVPTAILSRQTAGLRGTSLIVNLPGSPKSIRECLEAVFPAIPYCIDLLGGPYLETKEEVMTAFRPAHARREQKGLQ